MYRPNKQKFRFENKPNPSHSLRVYSSALSGRAMHGKKAHESNGYVTFHVTKRNAANSGDVFLTILAPHSGHSSQPFLDANGGFKPHELATARSAKNQRIETPSLSKMRRR